MTSQMTGVLARAALYSFLAGVASGIIYMIIVLFTGGKLSSETISGSPITGAISFVIALVFFTSFMLYFSRKRHHNGIGAGMRACHYSMRDPFLVRFSVTHEAVQHCQAQTRLR